MYTCNTTQNCDKTVHLMVFKSQYGGLSYPCYGPWPLKSTGRHGHFLKSTCDIELIDMRQGFQNYSEMRQGYFLYSACDMGINKRQRHATLAFPKIDRRHEDPPSRAPMLLYVPWCWCGGGGILMCMLFAVAMNPNKPVRIGSSSTRQQEAARVKVKVTPCDRGAVICDLWVVNVHPAHGRLTQGRHGDGGVVMGTGGRHGDGGSSWGRGVVMGTGGRHGDGGSSLGRGGGRHGDGGSWGQGVVMGTGGVMVTDLSCQSGHVTVTSESTSPQDTSQYANLTWSMAAPPPTNYTLCILLTWKLIAMGKYLFLYITIMVEVVARE